MRLGVGGNKEKRPREKRTMALAYVSLLPIHVTSIGYHNRESFFFLCVIKKLRWRQLQLEILRASGALSFALDEITWSMHRNWEMLCLQSLFIF